MGKQGEHSGGNHELPAMQRGLGASVPDGSRSLPARSRRGAVAGLFRGLVVGVALYLVLDFALQMRLPTDGCRTGINHLDQDGALCVDLLLAPPNGLRLNDRVVGIGAHPLEQWLQPWGPRPRWPEGTTVPYTIVRQGAEQVLDITLQRLSLWPVLRMGLLYYLFSLTFLLLGSFVFWRRPGDPAARVFLVICLAVAVQQCGEVFGIQPSLMVRGWPLWWRLAGDQISWWLLLAAGLHFALIFPLEKQIVTRHPLLIPALVYGTFPVLALGALALGPTVSQGLTRLYRVDHLLALAGGLGALGIFFHSFRTLHQPAAKAQLRWLAWAAGAALLPVLALYSLPAILGTRRLLPDALAMMLLLLIPLAMAFSIVRYHLWDIDVIIRRSLVYGALTVLLTGLYVALVTVLQGVSQVLTGQTSNLALALSTLIIALLLQPVRGQLQLLVDRLFFRQKYKARQVLVSFTRALSCLHGTQEVLDLMLDAVVTAMNAESASVMMLDEASGEYHVAGAHNLGREAQQVRWQQGQGVAAWVERRGKPFLLQSESGSGETAAPAVKEAEADLRRLGAEVCIPLLVNDKVMGLLNLGARRSQMPYAGDDLEVLVTVARTTALALENARLHEERLDILRRQLAQVTAAQEEERRRIAQELHDGLGPALASLNIRLHTVRKRLARDRHPVAEEIGKLAELAQANIQDIRRLIYDLRPAALDELGLAPALREYLNHCQQEHALSIHFTADEGGQLPAAVEMALFRIAQEALNNVIRHAQASRVEVTLTRETDRVILSIADDGRGFDPQALRPGSHLGLWSMRERAEQLGGRLEIESAPGRGTGLRVTVPVPESATD